MSRRSPIRCAAVLLAGLLGGCLLLVLGLGPHGGGDAPAAVREAVTSPVAQKADGAGPCQEHGPRHEALPHESPPPRGPGHPALKAPALLPHVDGWRGRASVPPPEFDGRPRHPGAGRARYVLLRVFRC